ncbi:hypothetical protein FE380_01190 [Corynebacterium diphtheriae]|nr:hypothetical protein FE380_01190 [Corynebacterium diphtheriae]
MKDGVPAGKYTAILEGNLHTTKWCQETLELSGKMDNPLLIDPSHHKHAYPPSKGLVVCCFYSRKEN